MKAEKSQPKSNLTCCLVTGLVGGLCAAAILLFGAAIAGFLHYRSVGQRQLAEQQAVLAEQLRARMEADMEAGELPGVAGDEAADPSRLSEAIRLVPPAPTPRRLLELAVDREGQVRTEGQIVNADALQQILRTEATAQGVPPQVLIRADRQCPFGHIATVLAVCRETGVQNIQLKALDEP